LPLAAGEQGAGNRQTHVDLDQPHHAELRDRR
jgi:hypothetical protein